MNNKRNLVLAGVLILGGCVGGSGNVIPVEDRTGSAQKPVTAPRKAAPGTVVEVAPSSEVRVMAVDDLPIRADTPSAPAVSPVTEPEQVSTWATPRTAEPEYRPNPAVVALLGNADQQINRGAYSAAGNTLERAQRIAPREPEVYYQMARLRLKEGAWKQAEQLALKGVEVASGAAAMTQRLWLLIADIREAAGDRSGAQRARMSARRY